MADSRGDRCGHQRSARGTAHGSGVAAGLTSPSEVVASGARIFSMATSWTRPVCGDLRRVLQHRYRIVVGGPPRAPSRCGQVKARRDPTSSPSPDGTETRRTTYRRIGVRHLGDHERRPIGGRSQAFPSHDTRRAEESSDRSDVKCEEFALPYGPWALSHMGNCWWIRSNSLAGAAARGITSCSAEQTAQLVKHYPYEGFGLPVVGIACSLYRSSDRGVIAMRCLGKLMAALPLIAGAALFSAAPNASAAGTYKGCPYGAVCIYPQNAGWNGGHPERGGVYFSYGAHNLSNQFGNHYVFNNQYGGASVTLNKGYNGRSPYFDINQFTYCPCNLTPTNSITLIR